MDEENIYSMFDISAKQQEKIIFRHQHAPEGINLSDTDPTEHRIDEESLSLVYDGGVLKPAVLERQCKVKRRQREEA